MIHLPQAVKYFWRLFNILYLETFIIQVFLVFSFQELSLPLTMPRNTFQVSLYVLQINVLQFLLLQIDSHITQKEQIICKIKMEQEKHYVYWVQFNCMLVQNIKTGESSSHKIQLTYCIPIALVYKKKGKQLYSFKEKYKN